MTMGLSLQPGDPLWEASSDYMTGIGMAVDGAAYRLGVTLDKHLAYEFRKTSYHGFQVKTPPVNFRTPFGGVNVPTGLVKGAANILKAGGAVLGIAGIVMTGMEIGSGRKI